MSNAYEAHVSVAVVDLGGGISVAPKVITSVHGGLSSDASPLDDSTL